MKDKSTEKVYWRKYEYLWNAKRKYIFRCDCQKDYVSFPALYLHCQKKHDIKISTKPTKKECTIIQKNGETIMCYHIDKNGPCFTKISPQMPSSNHDEQNPNFRIVLQEFQGWALGQQKTERMGIRNGPDEERFKLIKSCLSDYIDRTTLNEEGIDITDYLPYYFNGFVVSQMEGKEDAEHFSKICTFLMILSQWLSQQKYTKFQIKPRFQISSSKEFKLEKTASDSEWIEQAPKKFGYRKN